MIRRYPRPRTFIQVFGAGWGKKKRQPNLPGQERCNKAIALAEARIAAGHEVIIVVAPGCEVWCREELDRTMAMVYARSMRVRLPASVSFLVNRQDKSVWNTISEINWGYEAVCRHIAKQNEARGLDGDDMTEVTIEYVSNERHLRRAAAIARYLIGPPKPKHSGESTRWVGDTWHFIRPEWRLASVEQKPSALSHEAGGYVVLTAHRVGLGKSAVALVDALRLWQWKRRQRGRPVQDAA
jgi:hypothetical protein